MGSILLIPLTSSAQVQINGSVDFELSQGGDRSRFITNSIPSKYKEFNLGVTQLNTFLFAPITNEFFFEARVQLDTWGNGDLNSPRIALANITWSNPDNDYLLRLGRIISPFGFYAKRQISTDRVFVNHPLGYTYFTNISDKRGFWPQAGNNLNAEYQVGDLGLPTLYFGGYTTGIGTTWEIKQDQLFLDAAVTNGTPISISDRSTSPNIAGITRLEIIPSIYWSQGISLSYGSFMQADAINENERENNNFQKFTQLLIGTDTKLAFTYFEIVGEAIFSRWNVPRNDGSSFERNTNGVLTEYQVSNFSGNIDIKYEPPLFTGGFIAFRTEGLYFMETTDSNGNTLKWDNDVSRITGVLGYKLSRNILMKASFSEQGDFDGQEYAFRFQLSAFF
ncbi:MAG: hypothetical protein JXR20_12715 [Balneola sp.]